MPDLRLPAVCDVSVTNVCNAACDFCGFARDKTMASVARYLDAAAFARALPILHRRGIRFMTLQGGEPLVHPGIVRLVSKTTAAGISCAIITNAWFLSRYIDQLAAAGLDRLIISIDSANLAEHELNRGLEGLERRIAEGIARARKNGLPVQASVTVNRLVRYEELPDTLRRLGFDDVAFSYPRHEPFGSTSLVYSEDSPLVDLDRDELLAALDAIDRLRKRFSVVNPRASLGEVARYVRGEPQAVPCIGGYKYFYLDWNLDISRCEAWDQPLGSVFDLDRIPDQREPCNACMMACYRNASMLMHAAVAATDAARALAAGRVGCRRGIVIPTQRGAVALGACRRDAEIMPSGWPTETDHCHTRRPCGWPNRDRPGGSVIGPRTRLPPLPRRLSGLRAAALAAALLPAVAECNPSFAQRADSNIGLEGGLDHLFDAILGTPNRKTPVPQDNNLATAPGATQAAPAWQSKTKATGTPPVINRVSPGGHR